MRGQGHPWQNHPPILAVSRLHGPNFRKRTWNASQISEELPAIRIPERQGSAQLTDPNVDPIPGQGPTQPTDPSERGRKAESGGYTRTTLTEKAGSAKVPM
jgi:hypothetical protein